jgi:hypothetical protein
MPVLSPQLVWCWLMLVTKLDETLLAPRKALGDALRRRRLAG